MIFFKKLIIKIAICLIIFVFVIFIVFKYYLLNRGLLLLQIIVYLKDIIGAKKGGLVLINSTFY